MIKFINVDHKGKEETILWTKVGTTDGDEFKPRDPKEPIPL